MTKFFLPTIQRKKILEDAIKGRAPKELFYGMIDNNVDFERDCVNTRDIYANNLNLKVRFNTQITPLGRQKKVIN